MNYPIWYLPEIGGGTLIALIAVFHVFISHFAVGGGLYLVMAEKKALREGSDAIMEFTRRHARFFLLVTMVLGSISGVGIWFIIALVSPTATSYLIHSFVFGWAAEWVFFMVEIAAAFVYFYMFGKMDSRDHLRVGYLYFFAAWMSLFLINGIVGAMLTPGAWAENGNFWQGFFNPSFWPSLFFRTFISILLAGCYGYLTASFSKETEVREPMTRFSGLWSLVALVGCVPAGLWYLGVLPEEARALVLGKSPTIGVMLQNGMAAVVLLLVITLLAGILKPSFNNKAVAAVAMVCAFISMGSFEWVREAARRPYVLNEVIYSNSIRKDHLEMLNEQGYLRSALWLENKEVTADNSMAAGRELFIHQCYACHTMGGGNNDLAVLTEKMSYNALVSYINRIHEVRYFMPPFAGTEDEAKALAGYIAGEIHGKEIIEVRQPSADPLALGEAMFDQHCSACHSPDDVAPYFSGEAREVIAESLLNLNEISDEMEPFSGSRQERSALADYLMSINGELEPAETAPLQAKSGEPVFEMNCSMCHEAEEAAEMVVDWTFEEIFNNLGKLDQLSDEMEPFAGSDEERRQLAAFLDSLKGGE
ncbi:c-type cytochrome [Desulfosediminicola sp.]|uniref:c-type cytochrome n=1 Tax=Desulfosediminicola sp. TaxID=2886825 RepID=UPI003AF2F1D6